MDYKAVNTIINDKEETVTFVIETRLNEYITIKQVEELRRRIAGTLNTYAHVLED